MENPFKKLCYHFSMQSAIDGGFSYKQKPIKLSAKRKKELMEASALETPHGKMRSVLGVLSPYITKAGPKELVMAIGLLSAALYLNSFSVDMTADFGNWIGTLTNTVLQESNIVTAHRPEIITNIIDHYPALQETLTDNPLLNEMLLKFPDGSKILQDPQFKDLIASHAELKELLGKNPTLETLFMHYPGFAEKVSTHPEILDQLRDFGNTLSDRLRNLPEVKSKLNDLWNLCFGAFIENSGNLLSTAFNSAVQNIHLPDFFQHPWETLQNLKNPFNKQTGEALETLWNSKDLSTIVLKFAAASFTAYESAQLLALRWRSWSTGYYTGKYTDNKAFERIKNIFNNIDNPGQRLQEDPDKFTSASVSLLTGVTTAGMTLAKFSGELLDMGPVMGVPGGFFWIGLAYSAVLLALTTSVAYKLPEIYRNKQRVEANLRRTTDNIHNNTGQIVLKNSEDIEKDLVKGRIRPVMSNSVREISTQVKMIVMDSTVGNLSIPLPYLVVAFSAVAAGTGSMGTVATLNYAFNRVNSSLSFIVNRFEQLSNWIATSQRIYALDQATDAAAYIEEEKRQASARAGLSPTPPAIS